jgi:hypothetical protein
LIQDEFFQHQDGRNQWTVMIREFKNSNGDLDLREKDLKSIDKAILEAGKVNRLNLDKNKI